MSTLRPHIALLTLAPMHIGGAERNMLQIASGLSGQFQFTLIGPMSPEFEREATRVAPNADRIPFERPGKFDVGSIRRLRLIMKSRSIDVLHTHDARGRLLGHLAVLALQTRSLHTYHMSPLFYGHTGVKYRLYELMEAIYNRALSDGALFVSNNVKNTYATRGLIDESSTWVVTNGFDAGELALDEMSNSIVLRRLIGADKDDVIAVFVGRMTEQKGLDILLQALRLGVPERLQCVLIGDGPDRPFLEQLTESLPVKDRVHFLGFKSKPEVLSLLAQSDFFLLPSRYECFPYSILEALSSGLPVLATDVGGNSEMVRHGINGLLIPAEDAHALTSALNRIVNDNTERGALAEASKTSISPFTVEAMLEETATCYSELLA